MPLNKMAFYVTGYGLIIFLGIAENMFRVNFRSRDFVTQITIFTTKQLILHQLILCIDKALDVTVKQAINIVLISVIR